MPKKGTAIESAFSDVWLFGQKVANALAPELEAYDDFVAHREEIAAGAKDMPSLDDARAVMQSRMRRRRSRSRAGGSWSHSTNITHYF